MVDRNLDIHDHTRMDDHVDELKKCKQCGKAYEPKAEHQKFCGIPCHDAYWKEIRRIARRIAEEGLA